MTPSANLVNWSLNTARGMPMTKIGVVAGLAVAAGGGAGLFWAEAIIIPVVKIAAEPIAATR